jgi:Domain of unknown function (DUF6265)
MPLIRPAGALVVVVGLWMSPASEGAETGSPGTPLDRIAWLGGCLELRSGDLVVEEHRMRARGGSMLGMSRTTSSKGLVEYELTLVRERDGALRYEAHPSGQPAAVFTAVAVTADSVVFSAPEHDYPQIVGYRRLGADSVLAWIDGTSRGKQRRVEFPYRRVACAESLPQSRG